MAHTVRLMIYVASPLIEKGIGAFLRDYPHFQPVHITNNYHSLTRFLQEYQPDLILFFTSPAMPQHVQYVTEYYQYNRIPLLLLVPSYDRDHASHLLKAGIHGYVLLGVDDELLPNAIATVAVGGRWFSSTIDNLLFRKSGDHNAADREHTDLNEITEREQQIMQLIARGLSNQQIGQSLGITERTVRFHLRNIYDKLNFSTRSEAIVWIMKSKPSK